VFDFAEQNPKHSFFTTKVSLRSLKRLKAKSDKTWIDPQKITVLRTNRKWSALDFAQQNQTLHFQILRRTLKF